MKGRHQISQIIRASTALSAAGFTTEEIQRVLIVPSPNRLDKPDLRRERMVELYKQGRTLEEIGVEFGITRERVRQIVRLGRAHGGQTIITEQRKQKRIEAKRAKRDARARAVFGCDYEMAVRLNDGLHPVPNAHTKAGAYLYQKRFMQGPHGNVVYTLTFPEWIEAWGDKCCFRGRGKWGLCRIDNSKGFIAGNVEPRELHDKAAETMRRTRARMDRIDPLDA